MKYPLITIAIPTYNRAKSYLMDTINSVLAQTYPNIEIIIADNCSEDNTEALVEAINDKRIRYYKHSVNIGPANNFAFCLLQTRGDYFLLLSDDDLIDHDFVDVCMKACDYRSDVGVIRSGTRIIDSKGDVVKEVYNNAIGLTTDDFFKAWFRSDTTFYLCSTLLNTNRLKDIGGLVSPYNLLQDVFASVQLAALYGRADARDIKASFRMHPNEATYSVKIRNWCDESLVLIDLISGLARHDAGNIRQEGTAFLARVNFGFAARQHNPFKRLAAYYIVFKKFNYRYWPPPIKNILSLPKRIRSKIKRKLKV